MSTGKKIFISILFTILLWSIPVVCLLTGIYQEQIISFVSTISANTPIVVLALVVLFTVSCGIAFSLCSFFQDNTKNQTESIKEMIQELLTSPKPTFEDESQQNKNTIDSNNTANQIDDELEVVKYDDETAELMEVQLEKQNSEQTEEIPELEEAEIKEQTVGNNENQNISNEEIKYQTLEPLTLTADDDFGFTRIFAVRTTATATKQTESPLFSMEIKQKKFQDSLNPDSENSENLSTITKTEVKDSEEMEQAILDVHQEIDNVEELETVDTQDILCKNIFTINNSGLFSSYNEPHEYPTEETVEEIIEPTHNEVEAILLQNGIYQIKKDLEISDDIQINYDFKRLVDSVL